jgi:hypothetical protein
MLVSRPVIKSGGIALAAALAGVALSGCGQPPEPRQVTVQVTETASSAKDAEATLQAERAKLSPEDRQLVEAQEWCAINSDERLGEMGPPVKVMVKDQPVFLCCGGCKKKALADPDKTLAKVDELKAKAKAAKDVK